MRHVSFPSSFHPRSIRMACVHIVPRVHSLYRTARDRRPAIICIKYAAHCHRMHFPLFVNYWNCGDDRMIVTSKIKQKRNTWFFFNTSPICPHSFSFQTLSLYFLFDMSYHIYAPFLLIFHPLLKTKTGSTRCKQTFKVCWRRHKTVQIIGTEQIQTGPDPFRHVKHSRSANGDGTELRRDGDLPVTVNISVYNTHEKILLNGDVPRWDGNVTYSVNRP